MLLVYTVLKLLILLFPSGFPISFSLCCFPVFIISYWSVTFIIAVVICQVITFILVMTFFLVFLRYKYVTLQCSQFRGYIPLQLGVFLFVSSLFIHFISSYLFFILFFSNILVEI